MYAPRRINGFGVWYDTYGERLHVNQVDVPQLTRMVEEAEKRMRDASVEDWVEFWTRHEKVYNKLAEKAIQHYWQTEVMH